LLDQGFAIDGHAATKSVVAYYAEGEYVPLSDALLEVQRHLVTWLAERGHEVQFK